MSKGDEQNDDDEDVCVLHSLNQEKRQAETSSLGVRLWFLFCGQLFGHVVLSIILQMLVRITGCSKGGTRSDFLQPVRCASSFHSVIAVGCGGRASAVPTRGVRSASRCFFGVLLPVPVFLPSNSACTSFWPFDSFLATVLGSTSTTTGTVLKARSWASAVKVNLELKFSLKLKNLSSTCWVNSQAASSIQAASKP